MPRFRGVLPLVSLAGLTWAAWSVFSVRPVSPAPPAVPPPRAPFPTTVSGSGVVEPSAGKTSSIGAPFAALVAEVFVGVGDPVTADAPLFRLDDRALRAEKAVLAAKVAVAEAERASEEAEIASKQALVDVATAGKAAAQARLDRLLALPRAEELPPLEARVAEARAAVADWAAQVERLDAARQRSSGVVSEEDLDRRRFALEGARKALARAEADLALTKAGAWAPDVAEARAAVAQAEGRTVEAQAAKTRQGATLAKAVAAVAEANAALARNGTELERAVVRAPSAAVVLDVNVRAGEHATVARDALVVLGDLSTLLVRVDVDEESVPMVRAGAKAKAVLRGFPHHPFDLDFVRIEPWVRPKRSLTGATNERVDTRVLQIVFRAGASTLPVYVGQQVDVFMEGAPRPTLPSEPSSAPGGSK